VDSKACGAAEFAPIPVHHECDEASHAKNATVEKPMQQASARDIAYTDSSGHFQAPFGKHGPFAVSVVPEDFLTNAVYEAVSAPSQVRAESDDAAAEIQIVVRRRTVLK